MSQRIILGSALNTTLLSIKRTESLIARTTQTLSTGKDVNSALDNPQNFFMALGLTNRASDLSRRMDGMQQSLRTIEEAMNGIEAIDSLIDQAEAIVKESLVKAQGNEIDPALEDFVVSTNPSPLNSQILQDAPDVYYRLNDTSPFTDSGTGGGVVATAVGGATTGSSALYNNNGTGSVSFDGVNDHIAIADSNLINLSTTNARSIELVFQANDISGRQVLYEEGANINGLTIYIDNGTLYFSAEDQEGAQTYADLNINTPINAGETYHVALVFSDAEDRLEGYVNGNSVGTALADGGIFPRHTGDTHIGGSNDIVQFHDGEGSAGYYFNGQISDVAIYNTVLGDNRILSHAESLNATTTTHQINTDYETLMDALNDLVIDAQYRGINLLNGDTLETLFNEKGTSRLITEGDTFDRLGLGLGYRYFDTLSDIQQILDDLRLARQNVRIFADSLTNDFEIIGIRLDFTQQTIHTLETGADDLTIADTNKEAAEQLALQTRQALAMTALSISVQSARSILELLSA